MKRTLFVCILIICILLFKLDHASFFELSSSLSDNEIAVTFLDDSLLLISLEDESILLSLNDNVSGTLIKKYNLKDIPLYKISKKNNIDKLKINYGENLEFSFEYASRKFCVGYFYDCDFTYLYKNDSYVDADVYFYNSNTINLLNDLSLLSYNVDQIVSVLWDQKNYMIVTY